VPPAAAGEGKGGVRGHLALRQGDGVPLLQAPRLACPLLSSYLINSF
jgi:hypothetical protein